MPPGFFDPLPPAVLNRDTDRLWLNSQTFDPAKIRDGVPPFHPKGVLGYAEVTANQTTISTETDLTNLTVTVEVAASRRIEVSTKINSQPSTNDNAAVLRIKESTTNLQLISLVLGRTNASETLAGSVILTPSAGSHTYKLSLQMAVGTGTVDLIASSTNPAFILVKDIGPA